MKKIFLLLTVLCFINSFSQNKGYKEYSYSELFSMIEAEKDTVFTLENALIILNLKTDKRFAEISRKIDFKDSLVIDKELVFKKVLFDLSYDIRDSIGRQILPSIHHARFNKKVSFENSFNGSFEHCVFKGRVYVNNDNELETIITKVEPYRKDLVTYMSIDNSTLEKGIFYSNNLGFAGSDIYRFGFDLNNSIIKRGILLQMQNQTRLEFKNNSTIGKMNVFLFPNSKETFIEENNFGDASIYMRQTTEDVSIFNFLNNTIKQNIFIGLASIKDNSNISWEQLAGKIIQPASFDKYFNNMKAYGLDTIPELNKGFRDIAKQNFYLERLRIEQPDAFNQEVKIRGRYYRYFKNQYQTKEANAVYTELKDLETARLKYLFQQNPSFDNFFTLKINQFLKVFSAYGTRPAKAIVFSIYVILCFALIYLFFPNSWDKHGRKRIVNRYTFFLKYMDKDAGIHEVYMDDQKGELLEFAEFKAFVESKEKKVPKIFTATALPLYKWAISGTKLSALILKRIDIMKGTWSGLSPNKRIWKSILLFGAFLIAIVYDIFIKILNALMLSINTFTTLGFGEIPIKGLPRYLAIIQGFIGWFMLTIFSVSLISQLLN